MTWVSPLLSFPGAAAFQGSTLIDALGVAWHYGNPLAEQRAAHRGSVVVDRSHRWVIEITGEDSATFLHNLLSQKFDDSPVGFAAGALDLDLHGHILHHMQVVRSAEGFYLHLPAAQGPTLLEYLQRMIFWSQVTITRAELAVLSVLGKPLPDPAAAVFAHQVPWLGITRHDILVPRDQLVDCVEHYRNAGAELAGLMAYSAERIRAVDPERDADLDDKTIPHEIPHWIGRDPQENPGYVHLNKGCYRGQETVARVDNLGRSPRLLVQLYLDGSAPSRPEPGDDIISGGRRVGRIGSVVDDYEYGPIALGLLKRSALDKALPLASGDTALSVETQSLILDTGPQAGRAAIARLKGN